MLDITDHTILVDTLSNGITLVSVPLPGTAAVTAIVLMGVGSRYESDAQQGLAHFTEHMVFKGGKRYPSAQAIAQALDAVGGEFNAYTSQEFTGFYTKTAAPHLELGLDVLSDMLLHASFPSDELEKEKGVIVEEINMYEDMPMRKVDQVLSRLVFGDTPLGRPIIGTKQSVTAFTPEDFFNYRHQFYFGKRCVIVVAGAVDLKEVKTLAERYFSELPEGSTYTSPQGVFQETEKRVRIEKKESEQSHLILAVKAYPLKHPKRYIFRVLSTILGGNMSSRLFVSVREQQGLCYYVRAVPDTFVDVGMLVAAAGVDNNRLDQAVAAIVQEMQKLRDELVSPEELNRAKQFILGKMLLGTEDSEQVAELYGMQQLLEGKTQSLTDSANEFMAVTAEEIQEVARELFVSQWARLAVIGPQDNEEKLDQILQFNQ
jgi:predicted Zn-dependent peptidase